MQHSISMTKKTAQAAANQEREKIVNELWERIGKMLPSGRDDASFRSMCQLKRDPCQIEKRGGSHSFLGPLSPPSV
jgi:hypothetical protein